MEKIRGEKLRALASFSNGTYICLKQKKKRPFGGCMITSAAAAGS
jgi:hypothetical protein